MDDNRREGGSRKDRIGDKETSKETKMEVRRRAGGEIR